MLIIVLNVDTHLCLFLIRRTIPCASHVPITCTRLDNHASIKVARTIDLKEGLNGTRRGGGPIVTHHFLEKTTIRYATYVMAYLTFVQLRLADSDPVPNRPRRS